MSEQNKEYAMVPVEPTPEMSLGDFLHVVMDDYLGKPNARLLLNGDDIELGPTLLMALVNAAIRSVLLSAAPKTMPEQPQDRAWIEDVRHLLAVLMESPDDTLGSIKSYPPSLENAKYCAEYANVTAKRLLDAFPTSAAQPQQEPASAIDAYARMLAMHLWSEYYSKDAPDFGLFDDTYGVLSQIDNMLAGLKNRAAQQEASKDAQTINLDEDEAITLASYISAGKRPVSLIVTDGRAGYGLYAYDTEYPDEGGEFIAAIYKEGQ
jgi:hypothetical protein